MFSFSVTRKGLLLAEWPGEGATDRASQALGEGEKEIRTRVSAPATTPWRGHQSTVVRQPNCCPPLKFGQGDWSGGCRKPSGICSTSSYGETAEALYAEWQPGATDVPWEVEARKMAEFVAEWMVSNVKHAVQQLSGAVQAPERSFLPGGISL